MKTFEDISQELAEAGYFNKISDDCIIINDKTSSGFKVKVTVLDGDLVMAATFNDDHGILLDMPYRENVGLVINDIVGLMEE